MVEEALRRIGLTGGEIRVYLALVEEGAATTGVITKKSGISGSKVYEVLDRLIRKGLASVTVKNNVKHFEAATPERILDYLNEKQQQIEQEKQAIQQVMPELLLKRREAKHDDVKVFMGFEGLKTANEDIITTLERGEEWLSMGLTAQPKAWEAYFTRRQKERAKKGIRHKHLLNEKYRSLYEQRKGLPHTEFRFLPESFQMPTSTEIYADKVIIMLLEKESPMAIMIENEAIARSFRQYFHALWDIAASPVRVYYGRTGAVRVLHEIVEAGKQGATNYGFGTDTNPYLTYLPEELKEFNEQEKRYRMKTKLLFMRGGEHQQPVADIRYLPKEFISPLRIMVYGDKVAMVDFTQPWTTIIIKKRQIADAFVKHFNLLWKRAKP